MKLLHRLAVFLILGLVPPVLHAQLPFGSDLVPTLTFSEHYSEALVWNADDVEYDILPSSAVSIMGGKFSMAGVVVDESTSVSISIGEFSFDGYLSDDPAFYSISDLSAGTVTLPLESSIYADAHNNPAIVGTVKVTWTASAMSFVVTLPSGSVPNNEYFVIADSYASRNLGTLGETRMACTISFADRSISSKSLFYHGSDIQLASVNSPTGKLARVTLSGGYDATAPTATVLTPQASQKVYYPVLNVGGSVTDTQSGAKTVSVKVNNGPVTDINVTGTTTWNLPAGNLAHLNEGANVISVRASDLDGNSSAWANTSVTYSKISPLVVTVSGGGTVSITGTTLQKTGLTLTPTAIPAVGWLFDHWEGTTGAVDPHSSPTAFYCSTAKASFTMQPFSSLTAVFVSDPNPFSRVTGNYTGLLVSGTLPNAKGGAFSLKMTYFGTFTGKLTLGGVTYPIKGQFDQNGHFFGTFGTTPPLLSVSLDVNFASESKQITGSASIGALSAAIQSDVGVFDRVTNPLTVGTGIYTFLLPIPNLDLEDTTVPQGIGYGTASINSAGVVAITGVLGDGAKFKASTVVSKDLTFPLFVPLYNKLGALSGRVSLGPVPHISDFDGVLGWFKPPGRSANYPAGFVYKPSMIGSFYDPTVIIGFDGGIASLSILTSIDDPYALTVESWLISLKPNKWGVDPFDQDPSKLTFTVSTATGLFTGSSIDENGTKSTFKGAVFQKQSLGAGVYLNRTQSGSVLLESSDDDTGVIAIGK